MRIALIYHQFIPRGGLEGYLLEFTARLCAAGHDLHIVASEVEPELEKNYEQSFTMVKETLARQMGATLGKASPGDKSAATQNANAIFDLIAKQLDWASVRKDYVALYASTFTEEELQGIIDFYKSAPGQAFVKKQPELMKKSMDLNQAKMAEIMPTIQQLIMQQSTKGSQVPRPPAK